MADNAAPPILIRKRAEVAAKLLELESQVAKLRADLIHLDAAARLIDPSFKPQAVRLKPQGQRNGWFSEGELPRLILDVLRTAPQPMKMHEIALAIMEHRGFDVSDRATLETLGRRVHRTLSRHVGTVERVTVGERGVGWRVKR